MTGETASSGPELQPDDSELTALLAVCYQVARARAKTAEQPIRAATTTDGTNAGGGSEHTDSCTENSPNPACSAT